jgi:cytochrome P450
MDAPRHTRLRRLVSAAFTPRQVARIEEQIARQASAIVDELVEQGDCDFVAQVSTRLPMWTISEMVGVPESDRLRITAAADAMVGWNDPDVVADRHPLQVIFESIVLVSAAACELAASRRRRPTDDLMSALVGAEIEGERLTEDEIAAFFVLLSVAGNDTTRHTISHTMRALREFPDQRARLVSGFDDHIGTAVEEMVRWATPVMTFRRTATRDVVLCGQEIGEGDKVALFYSSANRDERAFEQPERFDITRDPNQHVGFGGGGAHYCLGAALARVQLRTIFAQLLHRLPELEVGEPHYLVGNFINGISRMPCSVGRSV